MPADTTPPLLSVRITARLNALDLASGKFALKLDDGSLLDGVLNEGSVEDLAPMMAARVVVSGKVVCYPDSGAHKIYADSLAFAPANDNPARSRLKEPLLPSPNRMSPEQIEELLEPQTSTTGINAVIGQWPGDETDEEIAEALKLMK